MLKRLPLLQGRLSVRKGSCPWLRACVFSSRLTQGDKAAGQRRAAENHLLWAVDGCAPAFVLGSRVVVSSRDLSGVS